MEDLAGKINDLLSSPEGMQQLNSLASMLGLGGGAAAPNTNAPGQQTNTANPLQGLDLSSLAGLLGGSGGNIPSAGNSPNNGSGAAPLASLLAGLGANGNADGGGSNPLGALSGLLGGNGLDGDTIQTIMKLAPLLATFREEDKNTRLLHALRPHLGEERQKKLDEAVRILSLLRIVPLLKGQGILPGIL